jgi:hypothetical protein
VCARLLLAPREQVPDSGPTELWCPHPRMSLFRPASIVFPFPGTASLTLAFPIALSPSFAFPFPLLHTLPLSLVKHTLPPPRTLPLSCIRALPAAASLYYHAAVPTSKLPPPPVRFFCPANPLYVTRRSAPPLWPLLSASATIYFSRAE